MPRPTRADLPAVDFAARRARLAAVVAEQGLAALYVTDAADLAWVTGFTGSNGAVLVRGDGPATFVTDPRYEGRVAPADDLEVDVTRDLFAVVATTVATATAPVAFDPATVTHARALVWLERAEGQLVARGGQVATLRRRKDEAEVARLALACELTVQAWRDVVVVGARRGELAGRSERDLAVQLERRMVDLGADGVAFRSIVASGPNSAVPHHEPTERRLADGDLLTTDLGAVVDGYHADFTRTVVVGGRPDPEFAVVHGLVERAQRAAVAALRVGEPVVAVDTVARDIITAAGHGPAFVHGVGHGVGLAIHEDPIIALADADRLAAGMVLTVEPGVYLPGRGGVRIEDTVVVTEAGPNVLTRAPTGPDPTGHAPADHEPIDPAPARTREADTGEA